jgi:hypothetical protein
MSPLKTMACIGAALALGAIAPSPALADPEFTDWGTVVSLQGGWVVDQALVFHSAPLKNPDHCTVTNNGYITNLEHAGHTLFHTMLLSALLTRREVALVIGGCRENRPQIISVAIR